VVFSKHFLRHLSSYCTMRLWIPATHRSNLSISDAHSMRTLLISPHIRSTDTVH